MSPETNIQMVSCPSLVALVEEGLGEHPLLPQAFSYYFDQFQKPIDILILGCTHFPFFKETLKKHYPNVDLIDSSVCLSEALKNKKDLIQLRHEGSRQLKFLLTDEAPSFKKFIERIFKSNVETFKVDV